jgi:hypothetical protein
MRCRGPDGLGCHGAIRPGQEEQKRFEFWLSDGVVKVFGRGAPDGTLAQAAGRLVSVMHSKCYHVANRRAERHMEVRERSDWREPVTVEVAEFVESDAGDTRATGLGERVR